MKEDNAFYLQYKDSSHWRSLTFGLYNHLEEEGFIPSLRGVYKKKYTMEDFEMKPIPLTKEDLIDLKDETSILSICIRQCKRYLDEDQKTLLFPKDKCIKFGSAIVFIKLKTNYL